LVNAEEIQALHDYREMKIAETESNHDNTNSTEKTATAEKDNLEVAKSLLKDLRTLGFTDNIIAQGDSRLTRVICDTEGIVLEKSQPNGNEQLHSEQTVLRSSDQRSITPSAESPGIFRFENPSISTKKPTKRRRKTGRREGRNMQHGDIMDLDDVDAYETQREADIRRQRTVNGELVRIPYSRPVVNAIIAAHSQTPTAIANSVDVSNHSCPAPQTLGQDGPEHLRSPSLLSPTSDVIRSLTTRLIGGSGEESPLAGSTRQTSPPCKSVRTSLSSITLTCFQLKGSRSTHLKRHFPRPM
jgi:hypothetical protein